ncbi:MAG: hypothetical protein SO006_06670 [Muribaculaceae bacterium]|nr:hypothetical protein [Muribaculaceae bacterium]
MRYTITPYSAGSNRSCAYTTSLTVARRLKRKLERITGALWIINRISDTDLALSSPPDTSCPLNTGK